MPFGSSAIYQVLPAHGALDAIVHVPGSKSIANRALVCATLADGMSVLRNVPGGDDTSAMSECVAWLGAGVSPDPHDPTIVSVYGTSGVLRPGPMTLHTRLAGTTSRFVTALCALGTGQQRGELVGVDHPPAAGPQHLAGVVVERCEPLGRWRLDGGDHAGAQARVEAHHDLLRRAVRTDHPAVRLDLLDPSPVGERRDLGLQRGQLVDLGLHDRPDVHPHVVHVQCCARCAPLGAGPPDRLEAVLDGTLRVGERSDRTLGVADDGELPHLSEGDQSLVPQQRRQ